MTGTNTRTRLHVCDHVGQKLPAARAGERSSGVAVTDRPNGHLTGIAPVNTRRFYGSLLFISYV
jgi:hypothetical protein